MTAKTAVQKSCQATRTRFGVAEVVRLGLRPETRQRVCQPLKSRQISLERTVDRKTLEIWLDSLVRTEDYLELQQGKLNASERLAIQRLRRKLELALG